MDCEMSARGWSCAAGGLSQKSKARDRQRARCDKCQTLLKGLLEANTHTRKGAYGVLQYPSQNRAKAQPSPSMTSRKMGAANGLVPLKPALQA
jgi:hypothetical protein